MDFTEIARGYYLEALCVEGNTVWFGDVIGGGIHRFDGVHTYQAWLKDQHWIAAMLLNVNGEIIYSGPSGIQWFNPTTHDSGILLDTIAGQKIRGVNEMTPDRSGGMYFGSIDLQSIIQGKKPGPSSLNHLSVDRCVTRLDDGLAFSNGLSLSQDGKRLFHNESFVGVFAYDINSDGSLGEKQLLLQKEDCDGMALDSNGHIWVSGFNSNALLCLSGNGDILHRIEIPTFGATNLRFGGETLQDLYINTVAEGVALQIAKGILPTEPQSILYRGYTPRQGLAIPRTHFQLD